MKKLITTTFALGLIVTPALALAENVTTSAPVNVGIHANATTTLTAKIEAQLLKAKAQAKKEIDRRNEKLMALIKRIEGMKHISASDKAALESDLNAQISALASLQAKIDRDTATSSLKADVKSITDSYRIFALVMPKAELIAAADRVLDVAGQMAALSSKFTERITALQASSTDVSALVALHADYDAKITDAQAQANAAVSEVANLKPDNGDKVIAAANLAAMKDARGKIQAAQQDLVAARKDAEAITKGLKKKPAHGPGVSATSSASTGAQVSH